MCITPEEEAIYLAHREEIAERQFRRDVRVNDILGDYYRPSHLEEGLKNPYRNFDKGGRNMIVKLGDYHRKSKLEEERDMRNIMGDFHAHRAKMESEKLKQNAIKREWSDLRQEYVDTVVDDGTKVVLKDGRFDSNILKDLDHVNDKVKDFWLLTERMVELYSRKNKDYGDSFDKSLYEDGLLVAKIRLGDKMRRFNELITSDSNVDDESMKDTLIDIANYAAMTLKWVEEQEKPYGEYDGGTP